MKHIIRLAVLAVVVAVLVAAFADHRQRSLVDWREVRAVALHADDWGFAGLVPDAATFAACDREALSGVRFPEVYLRSTLESADDVRDLTAVLAGHLGRDEQPSVYQPNFILDEPHPAYPRPGLEAAYDEAMAAGVWHPELHGARHFDPDEVRRLGEAGPPAVSEAYARGVFVLPGVNRAYELHPDRAWDDVLADWNPDLLARFDAVAGRAPSSVIAPDYVWDDRHEDLWRGLGLQAVQAKREQRRLDLDGPEALVRLLKFVDRKWDALTVRDILYVERNARFETAQDPDPAATLARCRAEIDTAWRAGEPAVVETHRVNVVQTDPEGARDGRRWLDSLLTDLDPAGPLYVADEDLLGLARRGIATVERGGRYLLRNPGPASRLALIPGEGGAATRWILVPSYTTVVLDGSASTIVDQHPLN